MSDYQIFKVEDDTLLRDFLEARISSRALKSLKKDGDIHVNGAHQTVRYPLKKGDVVELFYPDEKKRLVFCLGIFLYMFYMKMNI